jgi:hypothetical protein
MSNKKTSIVTKPKDIQVASALLEKVSGLVPSVALTSAERRRIAKMHRGGHQIVERVAQLASQYGVEVTDRGGDDLAALLDSATRLRGLLVQVEMLRTALKDAILRSESDAWTPTLAAYAALVGIGKARPELRAGLADVESWFRHRRAVTKAPPPPPPAPAPNGAA